MQWWSNPLQQALQSLQCLVRSGITIYREGRREVGNKEEEGKDGGGREWVVGGREGKRRSGRTGEGERRKEGGRK